MSNRSLIPRATYRLQLNRDFTFAQAAAVVPYLSTIGVSHCYVSPCLKARPGSTHGYDIVDHNSLNPEIGSQEDFDRFVSTLHHHGMGLILDIVPNHMGVMGSDNAWWLDVLENGEASIYAGYFDIDWHPLKEELQGKVLVPILHDHYGAVLESGGLKLVFNCSRGELDIVYHEHRFPVDPREYPRVLQPSAALIGEKVGEQNSDLIEFQSLVTALGHLPERQETKMERIGERNRDKEIHKRRLAALCARSPEIDGAIGRVIERMNGVPGDSASFDDLHELIKAQAFRLASWTVASDDINYRRFFDTNDLAGIRMEDENVFEATHRLVFKLIAEGKVDGLRIDHPDGLYDPAEYFKRLQTSITAVTSRSGNSEAMSNGVGSGKYVVIEKILTGPERLPADWAVCGTTGYDFSNLVNGLFVEPAAAMRMERIYRNFNDDGISYNDLAYDCRKLIMRVALASELNVLANQLSHIALSKRRTCDFTLNSLSDALAEIVASFPVYRTYVSFAISEDDTRYIRAAVLSAKWRSPAADTSIFDFISAVLMTRIAEGQDPGYRDAVIRFAMKCQQFTSPVMAKGLEDTAFYRSNRLVSLNDVGSDPRRFGVTTAEFHLANQERLHSWPQSMLATSTHDSKRSEDVRARINVLSEISGLWRLRLRDWKRFNRRHKRVVNEKPAPSPNDEYLLYQTLVGAWPLELTSKEGDWNRFRERIETYMLKAIREAKQNTSWINRNEEYENAVSSFVRAVLTPGEKNRFLSDFIPFQRSLARIGLWNSLSQTLLKLTSPGVPDIYQGNELWEFSLVDPDNRRPVDFTRRERAFADIRRLGSDSDGVSRGRLLETPEDDRLKLYVIWKTLCLRKQMPKVFEAGEYVPLGVAGAKANHVVAFLRRLGDESVLVVAPRLIGTLLNGNNTNADALPIGPRVWDDTHLLLPVAKLGDYRNVFTEKVLHVRGDDSAGEFKKIAMSELLADFPVALYLQR